MTEPHQPASPVAGHEDRDVNVRGVLYFAGGLFAVVAGNDPILMWIALPIAILFASYAASAVGFVAGQAAFTLTVIIIFNLISPAGWQVGLVRVEDVALGTGISVVVGVLLWPRGARRDFARSTAGFYRALIAYVGRAFHQLLGMERSADVVALRADVVRARDRAGEAFDSFLNERGAKPLEPHAAARLVSAGSQVLLAGDLLIVVATDLESGSDSCADGTVVIDEQVRVLLAEIGRLADELAGRQHQSAFSERPSTVAVRAAAVECMRRAAGDERAVRGAIAVVIAGEWVQNLDRLAADIEQPVKAAEDAARLRWWR